MASEVQCTASVSETLTIAANIWTYVQSTRGNAALEYGERIHVGFI